MRVHPRVLVTGASGLLGGNLAHLAPKDVEVVGIAREKADLTTADIPALMEEIRPTVIIHTAALTNVDACEKDSRELAKRLHVDATRALASWAADAHAHVIHISTDHIFDGKKQGAYMENDTPNPQNYYAETKLLGEQVVQDAGGTHTIVRTNFFGYNVQDKQDLAGWMAGEFLASRPMRLFRDVLFSTMLVNQLAGYLWRIAEERLTGVYHIAGHDACSKYDFGVKLARAFGFDASLATPISVDESNLAVPRPKNMALDVSKFEQVIGERMPTIDESVVKYKKLFDEGYQAKLRT